MQTDEIIAGEAVRPDLRAALAALPTFEEDGPSDSVLTPDTEVAVPTATVPTATVPTATVPTATAAPASEPSRPAPAHFGPQTQEKPAHRWPLVAGGVALAIVLAYGAGALFFSSHFLPSTTVNGKDVSLMAVDDLAASVTDLGLSYQTHVGGDGLDLDVQGSAIGVSYDGAAYARQAADQQDAWSWPLEVTRSHALTVQEGIAFDPEKLQEVLTPAVDQANEGATQPTNATIGFDDGQGRFVIVPDALGTAVEREAVVEAVSSAVTRLEEDVTLTEAELVQPALRADDDRLQSALDQANRLVDEPLTLRLMEETTEQVGPEQLKAWVSLKTDDVTLQVSRDAVLQWGKEDLSRRYDTVGITRHYTRADGKDVEVSGGDYGWCIDSEALADQICERMGSGSTEALDVPMTSTAAKVNPGGADWPNRYIDVDISEQHMRVYGEDGQMVLESDVVTGIPSHATDQGVYTIFEHTAGTTLVGLDYDGDHQPDYRTWVNYWMPFNGGMGLHDAYWRGAFGGSIYQSDGSHGCVNLPSKVAEQLFGWAQVGDVVVVHY